jgi:hypothetical protein
MDACQGLERRRRDFADEPDVELLGNETVVVSRPRSRSGSRPGPKHSPRHDRTTHGPNGTPGPPGRRLIGETPGGGRASAPGNRYLSDGP